jgi:hypothetical protein
MQANEKLQQEAESREAEKLKDCGKSLCCMYNILAMLDKDTEKRLLRCLAYTFL